MQARPIFIQLYIDIKHLLLDYSSPMSRIEENIWCNNYYFESNYVWIMFLMPWDNLFVILNYYGILYKIISPIFMCCIDFFINYVKSSIINGQSYKNIEHEISATEEASLSIIGTSVCLNESNSLNKNLFN